MPYKAIRLLPCELHPTARHGKSAQYAHQKYMYWAKQLRYEIAKKNDVENTNSELVSYLLLLKHQYFWAAGDIPAAQI